MSVIAPDEGLSECEFIICSEVQVVIDFLEQLSACVCLVDHHLLLSLQTSSVFLYALVIIDLLETWVFPNSGKDLTFIIGKMFD